MHSDDIELYDKLIYLFSMASEPDEELTQHMIMNRID